MSFSSCEARAQSDHHRQEAPCTRFTRGTDKQSLLVELRRVHEISHLSGEMNQGAGA